MSCVKVDNIWYTCNDSSCSEGVKLLSAYTDQGDRIPYLLIYEKESEIELLPASNVSHKSDNPVVIC